MRQFSVDLVYLEFLHELFFVVLCGWGKHLRLLGCEIVRKFIDGRQGISNVVLSFNRLNSQNLLVLRAVRLENYVLWVLSAQMLNELLVLGQSVLHDLFLKAFLAERAVCPDFEPVGAALLVEVVMRVALENDYFVVIFEFLLANGAAGSWDGFVVVLISNVKESQEVSLQGMVVCLLGGKSDLVVDSLKYVLNRLLFLALFHAVIQM